VLELALREALQLRHNHIGSEHILLGLAREGDGVAAQVLITLGVEMAQARNAVLTLLEGDEADALATEDTQARSGAADEALAAAQSLAGGAPIGSHHLLEALANAEGSMAARVLAELGVDAPTQAAKRT
jgi:ATP-dependent Clp protease ATP-binding subunit ClpA